MAKIVVLEATLREAISFPSIGPAVYIATGPDVSWRGWNIFADTVGREIVVDAPGSSKRMRIPFENVKFYVAGMIAAKERTAEVLQPAFADD